jgi:tyrosyl-tRNA synthetase
MDTQTRFELIRGIGEEIITEDELKHLVQTNAHPIAYDGFEPSGLAHLPFGIFRPLLLRDLGKAGVRFKLFLADWHAWVNNKMGGDFKKIQKVGKYFIEVWKAAGIEPSKNVEFVWANEIMDAEYWKRVFQIAENSTLSRTKRALSIMGRSESELSQTSQLFYPMMQVSDIFQLDVDICQLGLDQRRANIMAREIAQKFGWKVPVAVHHHMLMGLQGVKQPDAKIGTSFQKAQELLVQVENDVKHLGGWMKKIDPKKHFAPSVKYDNVYIKEREYTITHDWQRIIKELKEMFEADPNKLNSFVLGKTPVIIKKIGELTKPLGNVTTQKPILGPRYKEWVSDYEKLRDILSKLINEAKQEKISLQETQFESKMSKSKPSSAIFVHDTEKQIREKINNAYCAPKDVENNPMLDYAKQIIFRMRREMKVDRPQKFGGPLFFENYMQLEKTFREGSLHPLDLKNAVAAYMNEFVSPIREHFEKDRKAKELYAFVKKQEITR